MVDLKVRVLMRDGLPYLRAAENPHTDMADLRASNPNSLPAAIDPALAEPVKMQDDCCSVTRGHLQTLLAPPVQLYI